MKHAVLSILLASVAFSQITIAPGESIQAAVNANPPGTAFRLAAGVHRMQAVVPKAGNSFTGDAGAVMNGAVILAGWTKSGNAWTLSRAATRPWFPEFKCNGVKTMCNYPQELFVNGVRQEHVDSIGKVGTGKWMYDHAAGKIHIGTNPDGNTVELSQTQTAIGGNAPNVTIKNLIIEKYAGLAQYGAIHALVGNAFKNGQKPTPYTPADLSSGWLVEDVEVRLNHGVGIRLGSKMIVRRSKIHRNGQVGITGGGITDSLVEDSEIAYNNEAGFDWGFEGGASKILHSTNMTWRRNHVHHNFGAGLWGDYDNINTVYDSNLTEYNDQNGIFHECNSGGKIVNNVARYNAPYQTLWVWGGQISIACSEGLEVSGNTVVVPATGGTGIVLIQQNRSGHVVRNNLIRGNDITHLGSAGASGAVTDFPSLNPFSNGNRFEGNRYHVPLLSGSYWQWATGRITWPAWRAAGHDGAGTLDTDLSKRGPATPPPVTPPVDPPPPDPDPQPEPEPEPAPLSVAITTPAPGVTLSGVVTIAATGSSLASVSFRIDDGMPVEDATAPFAVSMDTSTLTRGAHILTVTARDKAGKTATVSQFFIVGGPAVLTLQ